MKLTTSILKKIIKEELSKVLESSQGSAYMTNDYEAMADHIKSTQAPAEEAPAEEAPAEEAPADGWKKELYNLVFKAAYCGDMNPYRIGAEIKGFSAEQIEQARDEKIIWEDVDYTGHWMPHPDSSFDRPDC